MAPRQLNGVNGVNGHKHDGLTVLIIGAGIAGLSAAIGLRKQGHHVQVSKLPPALAVSMMTDESDL